MDVSFLALVVLHNKHLCLGLRAKKFVLSFVFKVLKGLLRHTETVNKNATNDYVNHQLLYSTLLYSTTVTSALVWTNKSLIAGPTC